MFAKLREKLKGYKTIIWSYVLMAVGGVLGIGLPLLDALDITQINAIIPQKYVPFAPLVLIFIGQVTKMLRQATTGPVGSKGDVAPAPNVKAGD
jgi:hypothetical protein